MTLSSEQAAPLTTHPTASAESYRTADTETRPAWVGAITVEMIAYSVLLILALVFRLAELDTIPLQDAEARQALTAWQLLSAQTVSSAGAAQSPLVFAAQALSFSVLGGTELASRVLTALGGALLVFCPLLFRDLLGRTRAFLLTLILFASPVMLLSSRFTSPVVWSLVFAALGLWALRRWHGNGSMAHGAAAVVLFACMLLLTDPGSILLGLALLGAASVAQLFSTSDSEDMPGDAPHLNWRALPWTRGLSLALLVIVLVSTLFLTHQPGLSSVGALLGSFARGLTTLEPGTPPLYPLLVVLFYEPVLVVLALVGVVLAWRRGMRMTDRFFTAWAVLAVIACILFPGATASHALWLVVPLAGMAARALYHALQEDTRLIWQFPSWSRWLVAGGTVGLLAIFAMAAQSVARALLRDPALGFAALSGTDLVGVIIMLMVFMFFVVGFFLATSVWEPSIAARGFVLGLALFAGATALGSGWHAAVPNASSATEPWHLTTTTGDVPLLHETLIEVAKRESRGFPTMPILVAMPDDPLIAWMLRDFSAVTPIAGAADAQGQPVVLLRAGAPDDSEPDLGGAYIGQDFVLRRTWSPFQLGLMQLPAWWMQRETRTDDVPLDIVHLWLREDVYAGVPTSE